MANIKKSITELIGNTPLIELEHIEKKLDLHASLVAKLESFNITGSTKDRIALEMIEEREKAHLLTKESVIIEPTSGNTGIGLSAIGTAKGYRVIIVMPETMSIERRKLIKAYGAEIVLSDGSKGMRGAIEKAKELGKSIPNSWIPDQFNNPANYIAHYKYTAREIFKDTDGQIDYFVAGVGTGGTITGIGKYLKEQNPNIKVIAVEPDSSAVLSGEKPGAHKIQGIGAGFIPSILDTSIYDEIIRVKNEDAFETGRLLSHTEGILAGISSGAALYAAIQLASKKENTGKRIVVFFPDSGDRYLSTELYAE